MVLFRAWMAVTMPTRLMIPLAVLLGATVAAGSTPPQVETLVQASRAWTGEHYVYPAGQPELRVLRITVGPGASLPWHRHTVPSAGYVLKGHLTVETHDGHTRTLRPGDTLAESVDVLHRGVAGADGVTVLVFYAAVQGQPVTVAADAPATRPANQRTP
jgi:quercetin dioxygenase-like cupin family protein